jgi:uncharacterized protein (TIGR00369 family)
VLPQEVFERSSGLEILEQHISGALPPPPIHFLTGLRPVEAKDGAAVFRMPASEWLSGPMPGRLYGGSTAFFGGFAVEGAFQTILPRGTAAATTDLKFYFLRPVTPDGRDLEARATVIHRGKSVAIATAEVLDADGKRVLVVTGSSAILKGRPAAVARAIEREELGASAGDDAGG